MKQKMFQLAYFLLQNKQKEQKDWQNRQNEKSNTQM